MLSTGKSLFIVKSILRGFNFVLKADMLNMKVVLTD